MGDKTIKDTKDKDVAKSPLVSRSEKLASAVYLVTNFLLDSDPLKWRLREKAVDFMLMLARSSATPTIDFSTAEPALSYIDEIIALIRIVVLDRHASPMNFSLLQQEYQTLRNYFYQQPTEKLTSFLQKNLPSPPVYSPPVAGAIGSNRLTKSRTVQGANKIDRQALILQHLKSDTGLPIKEIAQNLPNFSSKTVQRELIALTEAGLVKKTGERRWSRYRKA